MLPMVRLTVLIVAGFALFVDAALAQRIDPAAEARLRQSGGEAAVREYREELARKAGPTVAELAKAVQHSQASVRSRAMQTLKNQAYRGENIDAAIPVLKKCISREIPFSGADEMDRWQNMAIDILAFAAPDAIAEDLAKFLAENVNNGQVGHWWDDLASMNDLTVDIDEHLLNAVRQLSRAADIRQQVNLKYHEGRVLYCVAKHARNREQAGKIVLTSMRWPLGRSCYEDNHYRAVRLCAEQCGSLFPQLRQAYLNEVEPYVVVTLMGALAVYHEDAWGFFSELLQDSFIDRHVKECAYTSLADSWLRASPEAQQAALAKLRTLGRHLPTTRTSTTNVSRLLSNRKPKENVVGKLREHLDGGARAKD